MQSYNKVLSSKVVRFGLPLLAGCLVITEGLLWREKLAKNTLRSDSPAQVQEGQSPSANNNAFTLTNLSKKDKLEQVTDVPKGVFEYGGSTTWAPIRKEVDSEIQIMSPEFQLQYTSPTPDSGRSAGSGTGIQMLLDSELAFSQSSRALREKEKEEARRKGYELQQIAIAIDGIAIAVNPELNIPGLTVEQVRDIYTGKIKNWNEVGGPDATVIPYARRVADSGTTEFFNEAVLEDEPISSNVRFAEGTTAAIQQVSENVGGIYYASAPEIVSQCGVRSLPISTGTDQFIPPYQPPYVQPSECPRYRNQLNAAQFQNGDYPLTRKLFVIVKQNGQQEEQVGVAYANFLLSDEGQDLIESAGFVGIDGE